MFTEEQLAEQEPITPPPLQLLATPEQAPRQGWVRSGGRPAYRGLFAMLEEEDKRSAPAQSKETERKFTELANKVQAVEQRLDIVETTSSNTDVWLAIQQDQEDWEFWKSQFRDELVQLKDAQKQCCQEAAEAQNEVETNTKNMYVNQERLYDYWQEERKKRRILDGRIQLQEHHMFVLLKRVTELEKAAKK